MWVVDLIMMMAAQRFWNKLSFTMIIDDMVDIILGNNWFVPTLISTDADESIYILHISVVNVERDG